MAFILTAFISIWGLIALVKADLTYGSRALSACRNLALIFIKTAQVLFYDYAQALLAFVLILLACGNHFIIDYYIIFLYSSMILIVYHTLRLSKESSAIF